jgi:hypothetical protein
MKQALVKAAPPTKTIKFRQSIAAGLHASKRRWALAGCSTLGYGVHETALVDDGDSGTCCIASEQDVQEAGHATARFSQFWIP